MTRQHVPVSGGRPPLTEVLENGPLSEAPEISSSPPALVARGITKAYGSVVASDAIDLTVREGEILGLLGENGAGKSTLMKILLGLVQPDDGTILRHGKRVEIKSPYDALTLGIGMVHQHFSLIDALTVWENTVLGERGAVNRDRACTEVEEVSRRYGLPIDPYAVVGELSAGQRQRVEIVKCLRRDPQILILDEPTSVLTAAESSELFDVLRTVVSTENRAVVLISHKLAEISAATDRVTVLRKGRVVFRAPTAETTPQMLAKQMVGREVSLDHSAPALGIVLDRAAASSDASSSAGESASVTEPPALEMVNLTMTNPDGRALLDGVTLSVRRGEIVGLYGVEGNGQAELGDVLCGLVPSAGGELKVLGETVSMSRPGALHKAGIGVIPEDRHRCGVVLDLSVADNLALKDIGTLSTRGWLRRKAIRRHAQALVERHEISTPSIDTPLRNLSGGNQQKVVLARELSANPKVLIAAQPTHGLDIGAIENMYAHLRRAAEQGVAILLISTELEEVTALCSRIAVISDGRIAGVVQTAEASAERLGMLLGGEEAA
ncbi:ABC transporter ATP-binding protein [Rhodococcus sp. IEGM 1379]|uniref:ABC transporter ATP-binding protein n=1 Tax=Rhodococcus sp. IEGM 1379 TaxID=3047086 RepID=UPI0024B777B5|nr:ABC transporter ATP-binding protein [Rhodococcus sp. IEGM 1379]MDI9918139.1 ABC transporter ATP-binding protein [Rhodococcus sp. IEGM 1379]